MSLCEELSCYCVKKSEELAMKEADEGMAKEMQPDIVLMDRYQGELRELDKKIAAQSGKLTGGGKSHQQLLGGSNFRWGEPCRLMHAR